MKANKKFLIVGGIVLLLVIGGVVGALSFNKGGDKTEPESEEGYVEEAKNEYDKAKEANVKDADDLMNVEIDFDGLHQINPDVIAWIKIPGTNVDYPILQNTEEDDDYYLNRTMEGAEGLPGSIYMEKYDTPTFVDPVSVIYGHTLHDGTMFSELKKFRDKDFFNENQYIYTYDEDFNQFISDLKSCMDGNINEDVNVEFGDVVITLSTCIDEFPDQRWLVNAVLVDE